MTSDDTAVDELGPIDYVVIEFPGTEFDGTIAPALDDLVDRGLVRVLDLLIVVKDTAGNVDVLEISDLADESLNALQRYESEVAMLLSESDVVNIAGAIEPGTTAAILVWENLWAAPFGSAVRHRAANSSPVGAFLSRQSWPSSKRTKPPRTRSRPHHGNRTQTSPPSRRRRTCTRCTDGHHRCHRRCRGARRQPTTRSPPGPALTKT